MLALGLSLALCFLALEVLARRRFGVPLAERLPISLIEANAASGWRMLPGDVHYTYLHRVEVNSLGLRGPELSAKAAGERRILALGDSLIYGQGVADDQTVPAYLEKLLQDRGDAPGSVRVINAGHRAYDTRQELGLLEELGATLEPDTVVLFWFWNDIWERDIPSTCERLAASGPVTFDTGTTMEGWPRAEWQGKQLLRRSALLMTLYDQWKSRGGLVVAPDAVESALKRLDGYLARFQELAARERFELLFAAIPDANELVAPHPTAPIRERAMGLAAARGIACCDLKPALEALARGTDLPVLPYDGHYTPEANEAMARAIAQCLGGG